MAASVVLLLTAASSAALGCSLYTRAIDLLQHLSYNGGMAKDRTLTVRIPPEIETRLAKATDRKINPYAPSITQVVSRGLELALKEIEQK
jgi:hypothetical protein